MQAATGQVLVLPSNWLGDPPPAAELRRFAVAAGEEGQFPRPKLFSLEQQWEEHDECFNGPFVA